jgi:hypothetical protein
VRQGGIHEVVCTCFTGLWYEDCDLNTGTGFDDPVRGAQRRAVLCRAFSELAQLIIQRESHCY